MTAERSSNPCKLATTIQNGLHVTFSIIIFVLMVFSNKMQRNGGRKLNLLAMTFANLNLTKNSFKEFLHK